MISNIHMILFYISEAVISADTPAASPAEDSQEAKASSLPRNSPLSLQRSTSNASSRSLTFSKQSRLRYALYDCLKIMLGSSDFLMACF